MSRDLVKDINGFSFLSQTFSTLNEYHWWIQNAPSSQSRELLIDLDCIAARLERDENNKESLLEKVEGLYGGRSKKDFVGKSISTLDRYEREDVRQLFSFFSELKSAQELIGKGFCDINLVKTVLDKKTPDFSVKKEQDFYLVEVKNIRTPLEEYETLSKRKMYSNQVSMNFKKGLEKKIKDCIDDAKEKFEYIKNLKKDQKILVINFNPGIDAILCSSSDEWLYSLFSERYFTELELSNDITIWCKKYFCS